VLVRDDGSAVWSCFRCQERGGTRGGRTLRAVQWSPAPRRKTDLEPPRDATGVAARIWRECQPLAGSVGADYLKARCCDLPPAEAIYAFTPRYCPETETKLPALVAK
jgi:hypothetical protein